MAVNVNIHVVISHDNGLPPNCLSSACVITHLVRCCSRPAASDNASNTCRRDFAKTTRSPAAAAPVPTALFARLDDGRITDALVLRIRRSTAYGTRNSSNPFRPPAEQPDGREKPARSRPRRFFARPDGRAARVHSSTRSDLVRRTRRATLCERVVVHCTVACRFFRRARVYHSSRNNTAAAASNCPGQRFRIPG